MVATLDIALRSAGIGVLVMLALALARALGNTWVGRLGAAFAASVACHLACPWLVAPAGSIDAAALPVIVGCMAAPGLLWLFAAALFDDAFRPRMVHAAALALLVLAGLWSRAGTGPLHSALPFHLLSLACLAGALIRTVAGRDADLLASRRRFRIVLAGGIAAYALVVVAVETHQRGDAVPHALSATHALAVLLLTGAAALALLRPRTELLWTAPPPPPAPASEVEPALVDRLLTAVDRDGIHRTEGLTIAQLAVSLGVAEHRLRRQINSALGYRNFNDFLNHFRVRDAAAALADPARAGDPVLTIAHEVGYQSVGPFNRAFKAQTGLTPTEYRRAHLAGRAGAAPAPD